tara:strand:- start:62 stop:469 length:408 start_codon:yes stop_codon:yes gene_type:complete
MSLTKVLNDYYPGLWSAFPSPTNTIDDYNNINWAIENPPSKEEIQSKIQELEAAEPMRLLREERNRRLQETDWEMMRNAERDINNDELIKYRNDLRDLPALVEDQMTVDESNRNSALVPTIENGQLVFESWPTKP